MPLSLRAQRLKLTWLLAIPFFWISHPTGFSLLAGVLVVTPGLILRGLASGYIEKDRRLATSGPYARLRHPLYEGSFFLGSGLALAGGRWFFLPLFWILFTWVYGRTIRAEEGELEERFGDEYRLYRDRVPAFWPAPRMGRGRRGVRPVTRGFGEGFQTRLFKKNRGWESALGALAGLGILWLKAIWIQGS